MVAASVALAKLPVPELVQVSALAEPPIAPESETRSVSHMVASAPASACATASSVITIESVTVGQAPANMVVSVSSTEPLAASAGEGVYVVATSLALAKLPLPLVFQLADIMAGSVLLTLTTDAPGACPSASDAMTLLLDPVAEVDAGPDSTICNTCSYTLDGVLAGAANTGTWTTSGTGTFNNAQLLDATYTPSAQDIANGSVTLTLTSDDPTGPCAAVADDMLLTIAIANGIESQRTVAPLRVFPNPASTGQQLQFGKLLHNVRVYSASGALIQQHAQTASIALEAQGMYLLVSAEGTAEIIVQ